MQIFSNSLPLLAPFKQKKAPDGAFLLGKFIIPQLVCSWLSILNLLQKIVCYSYFILFIAEFNSLNVLYAGKSLFSITTLSISAYNDLLVKPGVYSPM